MAYSCFDTTFQKMAVKHVTKQKLQGKILVQIEVSMPPDDSIMYYYCSYLVFFVRSFMLINNNTEYMCLFCC